MFWSRPETRKIS